MEVSSQGLSYVRVEGFKFDNAVFTNLTQDHLDYHKTMENYAKAKQELFKKLKDDGYAIINYDDDYKNYYLLDCNNNITYGFNGGDYKINNCIMNNTGTKLTYTHDGKDITLISKLIGKYNVYNLLSTIVILYLIGIGQEKQESLISVLDAPSGRMETIIYKNNSIVFDYAHTPDALEKIITTIKEVTKGNIYTVFGCTGDRDRTKRPIMMKLATNLCKKVIITNDDPHLKNNENSNYEVILDRKKAIEKGIEMLDDYDSLLILGKGHEEYMIIGDKKIPFKDSNIVEEIINSDKELVK